MEKKLQKMLTLIIELAFEILAKEFIKNDVLYIIVLVIVFFLKNLLTEKKNHYKR